jgi:hypothetical protein
MNYGEVTNYTHFDGADFSDYVQQFSRRETIMKLWLGVVKYWALCVIALDVSFTVDEDIQFFKLDSKILNTTLMKLCVSC